MSLSSCLCAQKPECHSNTEGSFRTQIHLISEEKGWTLECLGLSSFKQPVNRNRVRSLPAWLKHIPVPAALWVCMQLHGFSMKRRVVADLLCSILWKKTCINSSPSGARPSTPPHPKEKWVGHLQDKHILYLLQGLCSNISPNGMPHISNLRVFAL